MRSSQEIWHLQLVNCQSTLSHTTEKKGKLTIHWFHKNITINNIFTPVCDTLCSNIHLHGWCRLQYRNRICDMKGNLVNKHICVCLCGIFMFILVCHFRVTSIQLLPYKHFALPFASCTIDSLLEIMKLNNKHRESGILWFEWISMELLFTHVQVKKK